MNRQEKESAIKEVIELFKASEAAFVVNYKGLPVALMQVLRKGLLENGSSFKVTKARLMKIAFKDFQGTEEFSENFKDQVGLVFVPKDISAVAKKLVNFSSENPALNVVSGFFESKVLDKNKIKFLASLPSREVLIAQLAGTLQAPMSYLARALQLVKEQREAAQ